LWRPVQELGLAEDYKATNDVGNWLRLFYGLSFLPPEEITDAFCYDFMSIAPNNGSILQFADYFCDTYVDSQTFSPRLWAQIPSDQHRTTYGAESFNRHIFAQFISPHPTFFVSWDILVKQQSVVYTIANSFASMAPVTTQERSRRSTVMRTCRKYTSASITRQEYLKIIGHKFPPVVD
jgi:hypothetical protein